MKKTAPKNHKYQSSLLNLRDHVNVSVTWSSNLSLVSQGALKYPLFILLTIESIQTVFIHYEVIKWMHKLAVRVKYTIQESWSGI